MGVNEEELHSMMTRLKEDQHAEKCTEKDHYATRDGSIVISCTYRGTMWDLCGLLDALQKQAPRKEIWGQLSAAQSLAAYHLHSK